MNPIASQTVYRNAVNAIIQLMQENIISKELKIPCEVFSRVCGFFRPLSNWNPGKYEEFKERKTYNVNKKIIDKKHNKEENEL